METGSNSVDQEACNHVVTIWEVDKERLAQMEKRISETTPQLLSIAAGRSSCCIFRVPQSLIDINGKSYQPRIVSIGPYHRGQPNLQMMEEHKWCYLRSLLSRTKEAKGITLEDYLKSIHPLEKVARECYSETIHLGTDEFLEMMVIDGCFMIELFRKVDNTELFEPEDPLVTMSWILPFFYRDFLRLENQIPFFVLERLFEISKTPDEESGPSLSLLAMRFFNNIMQRPDQVIERCHNLKGLHLLDLVRSSFIPHDEESPQQDVNAPSHIIHCVSKLLRSGIKLNPGKAESFLVVKFRRGVIEMPSITIDDFMSSLLLNCVAFEQCHNSRPKHFTTYATLLDCLVNTAKDVEYLCDRNIVENYLGTEAEVARFINNLGKDVAFDINVCYLSKLFNDVHKYHGNTWHVQYASFQYTYFKTPWSFISAVAAFVLLVLAFLQTFYTIYSPP
ncbi:UPF0481 protein At3g47200-like [Corylus avellana]|uniref:UPF0481 protein At3g47200-like n=1 Tax=Corylus avellana TaxID=13451 RepID=UPI001E1EE46B|nr:UPF0481 protein At3g47200-like [Corylus avellana]